MARLFDNASSQFLEFGTGVVTAVPLTMACWCRPNEDAITASLMYLVDSSLTEPNGHYFSLDVSGTQGDDPLRAGTKDGVGNFNASTRDGVVFNVWQHCAGVFASVTSRIAYLDGSAGATNTDSISPTGIDTTSIGRASTSTPVNFFSGDIAEVAIWNVALTGAEISILAAGYTPFFVRPQNLVSYWPLIGRQSPEIDLFGGNNLTVTGTTASAHTRTITSASPRAIFMPTSAVTLSFPPWRMPIIHLLAR